MRFMPGSAGRRYHAGMRTQATPDTPPRERRVHAPGRVAWAARAGAVGLAAALLAVAWSGAWADGGGDQRRAREAVLAGEIRPLGEILQRVQPQLGGEVIATELEREHGRWVYEFKVLRPDGRLVEWYVDARDGSVLKTEVKKGKR